MVKRSTVEYKGQIIGIESIYTVINGKQINIPEKLEELRKKAHSKELFCPCGCGVNCTVVAGDNNIRDQHFRVFPSSDEKACHYNSESTESIDSKIVLKCWLSDKLNEDYIQTRVPISDVTESNRKYELSFFSENHRIALNYCYNRSNLIDEKLGLIDAFCQNMSIIHIVDAFNRGFTGQYPEGLMKIQKRQGYCLLLSIDGYEYNKAELAAVFYAQNANNLWEEVVVCKDKLTNFQISYDGSLFYGGISLNERLKEKEKQWNQSIEEQKQKCSDAQARIERDNELRRLKVEREKEERQKRHEEAEKKKRAEEEAEVIRLREEEYKIRSDADFNQQDTPILDSKGRKWVKCEICGCIDLTDEFQIYGGVGHINLGICKRCKSNKAVFVESHKEEMEEPRIIERIRRCPLCQAELVEKRGYYGKFWGCSNYPSCKFTDRIK